MSETPFIHDPEQGPDEKPLPEKDETPGETSSTGETPGPQPESMAISPFIQEEDPLAALRESLISETPPAEPRPDAIKRLTGKLSPQKPPQAEAAFGVKTATSAGAQGNAGELKGDLLKNRPAAPGVDQRMRKTGPMSFPGQAGEPEEGRFVSPTRNTNKLTASSRPGTAPEPEVRLNALAKMSQEEPEPAQTLSPEMQENQLEQADEEKTEPATAGEYRNPQRFVAYSPRQTFLDKIRSLPRIDIFLIAVLVIVVLAFIVLLVTFLPQANNVVPPLETPTPTLEATTTSGVPIPVGLVLPGGWQFQLATGNLTEGKWAPTTSEWLNGTELRRVVAIPWNKQLEAVVKTFAANDILELGFSNGDKIDYKIQSVSQYPITDTDILYDTHPSLVVVLINQNSEDRWVVIGAP